MATPRADVSVRLDQPAAVPASPAVVQVPDVRMCSEQGALEAIIEAGLVPGARIPRPKPRSGCDEVVVRTHPRGGNRVTPGTTVDYEVLPGRARAGTTARG